MKNLREKTIRSGFWSLGGDWVSIGLGMVRVVILARLLSPQDFGVVGLAFFSMNVLNVFSELGIESALIQKPTIERADLNVAWSMKLLRGLILSVILFFCSGFFASYFGNEALEPFIKAIAVMPFLDGLTNSGVIYFKRELEFGRQISIDLAADLTGTFATIALAFLFRNAWALIAGNIVSSALRCLGSYKMHPYRPEIEWDRNTVKSLLNFGKHIFWITIVTFIVTSGDDALVGKLLGLTALGYYTMAYSIANIPVSSLTGILSRISFPAYSLLQKEPEKLAEAFAKIYESLLIILLPLTAFIILMAQSFTRIFLGEKWLPMVPVLQILCLLGLFRGLANVFAPVQLALNRPGLQARNKTIELAAFILLVYPATLQWGVRGTAGAVSLVYFISVIANAVSSASLVHPFFSILIRGSWIPLTAALGLSFSTFGAQTLLEFQGGLPQFLISGGTGLIMLGLILFLLKRELLQALLESIVRRNG